MYKILEKQALNPTVTKMVIDADVYKRQTVGCVEEKIAALEGGVGALCTTSGQAASMLAILNICTAGDHFVTSSTIYGGTVNLFAVTLKKFGIECTFVDADAGEEELQKAFRPNTKAVFGETIANPAIAVFDIEKFANLAHRNGVPLIVDNTCLLYTSSLKEYTATSTMGRYKRAVTAMR